MDDFDETTVIAVKAPPETRLEVPNPAEVRLILPFHCYESTLVLLHIAVYLSRKLCLRGTFKFASGSFKICFTGKHIKYEK